MEDRTRLIKVSFSKNLCRGCGESDVNNFYEGRYSTCKACISARKHQERKNIKELQRRYANLLSPRRKIKIVVNKFSDEDEENSS